MSVARRLVAATLALAALAAACDGDPEASSTDELAWLSLPPGFPAPPVPADNPLTPAAAELGRHLFYDTRLSANGTQACASCHLQELAFTDGLPRALGSTGQRHPRNAQSLTNVAYNATLTWAHPGLTELERQVLIPIFGESPPELAVSGYDAEVLERFRTTAPYPELFAAAFPDRSDPVSWDAIARALASFVRTLISGDSPFDRHAYQGDASAMSPAALRGAELFFSERLECHHCHGGFNFTRSTTHDGAGVVDAPFHNTGLYDLDGQGAYPTENTGVYEITGLPEDMGRFRAPTLRNVAVTAPYMHDGSMQTLDEVIRFYEAGGRVITEGPLAGDGRLSPLKSSFVNGFTLSDVERADLIAFLESLTDTTFLTDPRYANPFGAGP
ncbi:MAG: di-heme enzyme [Deltaproteobacteria bacterium]|nr:di-heme enzyme [Deltaproteobacteria bacterium]